MEMLANTSDGSPRPNAKPNPDDFKGLDAEGVRALQQQIARIQKLKNERRAASKRVTDEVKDTLAMGFDKQTLAMVMRLTEMEPDDREAFLHKLDEYATKLRYY